MIYLASPYSHPEKRMRNWRYQAALHFVSQHVNHTPIFSPIVYSHQFVDFGHGTSAEYWHTFNSAMMLVCSSLWVLRLEGWDKSIGVAEEIAAFAARDIPPVFVEFQP